MRCAAGKVSAMNFRVEVVCMGADGTEQRRAVMAIERAELVMETLGLNLKEGKTLLAGVQRLFCRASSQRIFEAAAEVFSVRQTARSRGCRQHSRKDGIRSRRGSESTLEPMCLSKRAARRHFVLLKLG